MSKRFSYVVRQRSAHAWAGLAAGLVMLALAADRGAPGWTWALLAPCILVCVAQIALCPGYGIRLSDRALSVLTGYGERVVPLCGIDHLRLTPTRGVVVLADGEEVPLPRQVLRDTLLVIRESTARGIPVRAL